RAQDVTLYFNRSRVGMFSTYMVVDNLTNPADIKVVRVEMEVVEGSPKDMVSQLFEVLVSPAPLVLDYGDVYEGKLYQRRSFVIMNHAAMPLEFQLSSSLPASELNFSLSAATLKQFKSVHVEAKTRLQVTVEVPC
ncbi:unnamed protein product, partial [Ectocarpus sp. 12 AP-2014]